MKKIFFTSLFLLFNYSLIFSQATKYAKTITADELKQLLYIYASDSFEGRETGTNGQKIASNFLRGYYAGLNVESADGTTDYFQPMTLVIANDDTINVKTENVVAIIKGKKYPNEYLVISAHLDHIGITNGEINNGALKDL